MTAVAHAAQHPRTESGSTEPRESARPLRRDALAHQERVLAAAVSVLLREGRRAPMATIAAEAGLGVGTLYRRYPNRDSLMDALTQRSFRLLVEVAETAEARPDNALARLSWWWDTVIEQRDQLVLPLGGAPAVMREQTIAIRSRLHRILLRLLARGQNDGSSRDDVDVRDVIVFGATLVMPLPGMSDWTRTARRQKEIYLDGLANTRRGGLQPRSGPDL